MKELHPLKDLFKYEVREIGRALGLPASITERQPFPGPGLAVRIIGIPALRETVDILRECDDMIREVLENHDLYDRISQLVVALNGVLTVGVKGDKRSSGYAIIVRPVVTQDFMTCSVYQIPWNVLQEIVSKVTQHPNITRVFLDITPKPPGTTEMQ